jgi:hypothetical protein
MMLLLICDTADSYMRKIKAAESRRLSLQGIVQVGSMWWRRSRMTFRSMYP